jgi:hypothetical protein
MSLFLDNYENLQNIKNRCFENIMWNKMVLSHGQNIDKPKHETAILYNEKRIKRLDQMKYDLIVNERNKQYLKSMQENLKNYFIEHKYN